MESKPILAVRCREDGSVLEVLRDDLDVASVFRPGSRLRSIVEPESAADADRLLREIREIGSALDIRLTIRPGATSTSLLASGCRNELGIYLIGARQSLTRESLLHAIASQPNPSNDTGLTHDALLALTAHDLRNHLNGILAAGQYLLDDAARLLEAEHVTLLRSIESSARDMFRVIDDVMEVSLLQSAAALDIKPTDVVALVQRGMSLSRSRARRKNVRLELTQATELPPTSADPARIERVMESLLASITDASASGGRIEVSFAAMDRRVMVFLRVESSTISREQVRAILDANHPRIEGVKAGTVLAFRVMRRVVEQHGGSLGVDSGAGAGFTIGLALPMAEKPMTSHGA